MSIYEVTQLLEDKNNIQNDMQEAINLIRDMFYKKYLQKIHKEIKIKHEKIKNNRPKEVELLCAIKPFVDGKQIDLIDRLSDAIIMFKTINNLQSEINQKYKSDSQHPDGVYDIDKNCLTSKNNDFVNAILMLAVCNFI